MCVKKMFTAVDLEVVCRLFEACTCTGSKFANDITFSCSGGKSGRCGSVESALGVVDLERVIDGVEGTEGDKKEEVTVASGVVDTLKKHSIEQAESVKIASV